MIAARNRAPWLFFSVIQAEVAAPSRETRLQFATVCFHSKMNNSKVRRHDMPATVIKEERIELRRRGCASIDIAGRGAEDVGWRRAECGAEAEYPGRGAEYQWRSGASGAT
ncbi:hypothetical protein BDW66DRAFT_65984 [Aspergillus desertorum]